MSNYNFPKQRSAVENAALGGDDLFFDVSDTAPYVATVPGPVATSLSFSQVDILGGGSDIVLTGTNLSGATALTVGGTAATITANTATTVSFQAPAKAAGVYDVVVTTPGGSSTLAASLESWAPVSDATCTLCFDCIQTPYNGTTGVWQPRYSLIANAQFGANAGYGITAASGGAPIFDGDAAVEAGLVQSSWSGAGAPPRWGDFLGPDVGGGRAGSIAAIFSSTTTYALHPTTPYQDSQCIAEANAASAGTIGLSFGTESGVSSVCTHIRDATVTSHRIPVPATAGVFHAFVSRWGSTASDSLDLSVDGALSGSGYGSVATTSGASTMYTNYPIYLGETYTAVSPSYQVFAGTLKAFAILNAKASNTFVTKFYKWAQQRFGVA